MAEGDPFASVAEHQAQGETAAIYADIRATLQVPLVNLLWRSLAAVPQALPWAWASIRPLHLSGRAARAAADLERSLAVPRVARLDHTAWRAAGVDEQGERQIRRTIASYARANLINAVTFGALRAMEAGDARAAPILRAASPASAERMPPLPALVALEDLPAARAEQVRKVSQLGCDPAQPQVQVSLPRQLAHWPGFIDWWAEAFDAIEQDGSLREAVRDAVRAVSHHAVALGQGSVAFAAPEDPAGRARAHAIIDAVVPVPIGRMLVILQGLRRALGEC